MELERLAYDDPSTPAQMYVDCRAAGTRLGFDRIAEAAVRPAPSLRYDDFPYDVAKREVTVSAATARLAAAIFGR